MHMVVFPVELAEFDLEVRTDIAHDLLAPGEHHVGEHTPPVLGDEHQMGMEVVDDMSSRPHIRVRFPPR
ncbi:hypothetical protein GCM10012289_38390 [Nonomuraea cavernae]|uniref:Uncharacterized protein n=1 Tax=Nonomuraea cavernae TaxID=2045107 RepID=A0A918DKA1_9ACTN|nr:hypothetical protein GCM10012289_38390 [Nonomuraea cavernae]